MTQQLPARVAGFGEGLLAALPIIAGYFPIAFAFGVAATKAGLTPLEATFVSVVVYAGASQFVAIALLAGGTAIPIAIATLLAMNVRHLLYGPALLDRVGAKRTTGLVWGWAQGLTDEVFGTALGWSAIHPGRWSERFQLGLSLGAYGSWVLGTAVGAAAGGGALAALPALDAALGFMLTALFLALLMSILKREQVPVVIAAALGFAGCAALGVTTAIIAAVLIGALAGAFWPVREPAA